MSSVKPEANAAIDGFVEREEERSDKVMEMVQNMYAHFVQTQGKKSGKYPVPEGFPKEICYKFCLGLCDYGTRCSRKHEKTTKAMEIIRQAAITAAQ